MAELDLPDPGDRHVLAAAIRCGAQSIVTHNLKDFPSEKLNPYGVEAVHPDAFVLDLIDLAPGAILVGAQEQAPALKNPPMSLDEVLDIVERNGIPRSVAELRRPRSG